MENDYDVTKDDFWPFGSKPLTKKEEEEFVENVEKEAERLFNDKSKEKNDPS